MDQLAHRDERDETRVHAPMKPAENAFVVDTSDLTIAQVVEKLLNKIQGKAHQGLLNADFRRRSS